MKILYIAERINIPDGSAVHCRSFVDHVKALGHDIRTFPPVRPLCLDAFHQQNTRKKDFFYYLKQINLRTFKQMLHRSNGYVSEVVSFIDGLEDSLRLYPELKRTIRRISPDIIIYRYRPFVFAPFWIKKTIDIPLLYEINALRSMEEKLKGKDRKATWLTRWAEQLAIRSADTVFAVSDAIRQSINAYGVGTRVEVVPNGVDTDKFDPSRYDRERSRKELGLSGKFVIGYVGSYKNWHGLDTTLQVAGRLAKRNKRYHLLMVGHGPGFKTVTREIEKNGLQNSVTRVEFVSHDRIPYYLSAFDIALMSYPVIPNFYFSPLKMFEYMAMEIPVVATRMGQIGQVVTPDTGVLVDNPTPEAFEQAIFKAEKNREFYGKHARRKMIGRYSWMANAEAITKICRNLVSE